MIVMFRRSAGSDRGLLPRSLIYLRISEIDVDLLAREPAEQGLGGYECLFEYSKQDCCVHLL